MSNPFSNFRSAIDWSYRDGLDADGFPANREAYRKPYIRGSEADAEGFAPVAVSSLFAKIIDRAGASLSIGDNTESPIELQLGAAVLVYFKAAGKPLKMAVSAEAEKGTGLLLIPQFRWSIYRSDWAVYNPKTKGALLLECDGAAFHSTQDQMAHDKKKDCSAHDRGFLTMRFTGSQIHRGADDCAKRIYDLVYGGGR